MPLMQTYFVCASLRLAVIKIGILAVLKSIILIVLFFINGVNVVDDFIERFQHNVYYKSKHLVSLIALIALTIVGASYMFVVGYDCCALISFIQVVSLVQSARYKAYYGDDPFNPKLRQPFAKPMTELRNCKAETLWAVRKTNICLTKTKSHKLWLVEGDRKMEMSK